MSNEKNFERMSHRTDEHLIHQFEATAGEHAIPKQEWRNTSYTGNSYPDQTYKPVLVDPAESLTSPRYVRKAEAYVQEVQGTVSMKMEFPRDYGVAKGRWGGLVDDCRQKVDEFLVEVPSEASRLTRTTPPSKTRNWHQATDSTFEDHDNDQWSSSKNADDRKLGDLIKNLSNWHQLSDSVCQDSVRSNNRIEDRGSNVLDKSDGKNCAYVQWEGSSTVKNPSGGQCYGGNEVFGSNQPSYSNGGKDTNTYFDYNDGVSDTITQGGVIYTNGSWSRASEPTVLSPATNDITEPKKPIEPSPQAAAIAAPMAPQPRFMVPRRGALRESIRSDEAQRLYGSVDPSSRAYIEGDNYLSKKSRGRQDPPSHNKGIINSTEAVAMYNGEFIT
ncbi:hypothetical protein Nepgr_001485 [Nepenthes gracilis]|uniref:Uncharacterized protein n=1 Tax=Nepenthes gracilis TaxID=150966 RepID=A0AAD3RXI0_NEPGR|nr:hypothetical protein Nepgr_001485 [Nepenthes gracilis]